MQATSVLEAILRHDRLIVIAGVITVVVLAWMYLLMGAGMGMPACEMAMPNQPWQSPSETTMSGAQGAMTPTTGMGDMMRQAHMAMMQPAVWTVGYAVVMGVMWWVMMIAMMLPSASPMLLLFARVNRSQKVQEAPFVPTSVFAAGYLVVWGVFSLLATSLQWGLERLGLLSTMMASTSALFGGVLLLTAGVYQLTPFKHACLRHCRNPFSIRYPSLAYWDPRRISDGPRARRLLSGVLLVPDEPPVCWRRHESLLDCRFDDFGALGKDHSHWALAWGDHRCRAHPVGRMDGRGGAMTMGKH